jgi:hypothetical protein
VVGVGALGAFFTGLGQGQRGCNSDDAFQEPGKNAAKKQRACSCGPCHSRSFRAGAPSTEDDILESLNLPPDPSKPSLPFPSPTSPTLFLSHSPQGRLHSLHLVRFGVRPPILLFVLLCLPQESSPPFSHSLQFAHLGSSACKYTSFLVGDRLFSPSRSFQHNQLQT